MVFLAALSGGADSTALAAALAALRDDVSVSGPVSPFNPFTVCCLHVNHGIRDPEACAADEAAAALLCKNLKVPFYLATLAPGRVESFALDEGIGIEAAARHFRYAALKEEARRCGAAAIVTAHTRDDALETTLMAVLRGAGPAGLGALARPGRFAESNPGPECPVLRPLLALDRAAVLEYLAVRGLSWQNDASNEDLRYLRNRIRRRLTPFLDKEFPHWRGPLLQLAETQALTAEFLAEAAARLSWDSGGTGESLSMDAAAFASCPEIIQEEALFRALDHLAGGKPRRPRRAAVRSFAQSDASAQDMGPVRLERAGGRITVRRTEKQGGEAGFSVLIKRPGVYKLKMLTITAEHGEKTAWEPDSGGQEGFFTAFPLVIRSVLPGESGDCAAEDRQGLSAVFAQGKIIWKRKTVPVEVNAPVFCAVSPAGETAGGMNAESEPGTESE